MFPPLNLRRGTQKVPRRFLLKRRGSGIRFWLVLPASRLGAAMQGIGEGFAQTKLDADRWVTFWKVILVLSDRVMLTDPPETLWLARALAASGVA